MKNTTQKVTIALTRNELFSMLTGLAYGLETQYDDEPGLFEPEDMPAIEELHDRICKVCNWPRLVQNRELRAQLWPSGTTAGEPREWPK